MSWRTHIIILPVNVNNYHKQKNGNVSHFWGTLFHHFWWHRQRTLPSFWGSHISCKGWSLSFYILSEIILRLTFGVGHFTAPIEMGISWLEKIKSPATPIAGLCEFLYINYPRVWFTHSCVRNNDTPKVNRFSTIILSRSAP